MNQNIAIIITTRNRFPMLKVLLQDIQKQTYKKFSVVVIDDGSTDETKSLTSKSFKASFPLQIIHNAKNLNMVKSRNKGLALVENDKTNILILDDDNRIDKNFLTQINTFLSEYSHPGIIGFKNYYKNKKTLQSCGCNYNLFLMFPGFIRRDFSSNYILTDVVNNGFIIKAEVFKKIGKFDEKYVIDFSETEYCFRAKKAGFLTVTSDIPLYHQTEEANFYGEITRRAEVRPETYFYTFRNKYLIVDKFGTFFNKLFFFGFFQFVSLVGYFYVVLKIHKPKLFFLYLQGFLAGNFYLLTHRLIAYEKKN